MADTQPLPRGTIHFPEGLPGFEHLKQFLLLQEEELLPLAFLTSLVEPRICLPVLPVARIDQEYSLRLGEDDRRILQLPEAPSPEGLLCLAVVNLRDGAQPPTANLLAPIVVNLANGTAKQVIQIHTPYSCVAEVY